MIALPEAFKDLEPFGDWSLARSSERNAKRTSSTMEQIDAFIGAIFPRLEEIFEHLDRWTLEELPPEERALFQMTLSLAELGTTMELFQQPTVPEALGFERMRPTAATDGA